MANDSCTDKFKEVIKAYLDKRAEQDKLFKANYAKSGKSIDECCRFIIGEVYKAGRCGWSNEEVFGLAVHYYDEDNIKVAKAPECGIVHTQGHDDTPLRGAHKPQDFQDYPKPRGVQPKLATAQGHRGAHAQEHGQGEKACKGNGLNFGF